MGKGRRRDWWNRPEVERMSKVKIDKKQIKKAATYKVISIDELHGEEAKSSIPKTIYRFLDDEGYAKDFVNGQILVTTLECCRNYKNAARGDKNEGREVYHLDQYVTGNSYDSWFQSAIANTGIVVGEGCYGVTVGDIRSTNYLSDAYVLPTTIGFSDDSLVSDFGEHCVEIFDVAGFAHALNLAMREQLNTPSGLVGQVTYASQLYRYGESRPGVIGFVKEPKGYEDQEEFRFLWESSNAKIDRVVVNVPDASRFCRLRPAG
ncbi:hypothetical protein ACBQ21_08890 [Pseudomonas putida]|uniref:hypothetical protein n=1 Tax=Pseudomonas putida TaxID=303 RepID=UPI003524809E